MLRKLLEKSHGPINNSTFKFILELTTLDIKANRIGYNQRTNIKEAVDIAERCYSLIQR